MEPGDGGVATEGGGTGGSLGVFLRRRGTEILSDWERESAALPSVSRFAGARQAELVDHVPELLQSIATFLQQPGADSAEARERVAELHAAQRLGEGFDLNEVVLDLSLLRQCIVRRYYFEGGPPMAPSELHLLNTAFDHVIAQAVKRYVRGRDRLLLALDRISQSALGATSLRNLLDHLVVAMHEGSPAVDLTFILLRDGEQLQVEASAGIERDVVAGHERPLHRGFPGAILAEGAARAARPEEVAELARDVPGLSPLRSLYGVPLVSDRALVGVACMGSVSAAEATPQDVSLFAAMASRASIIIEQHMLREAVAKRAARLERSEAVLRAIFDNAAVGIAQLGLDGAWVRGNDRLAAILGVHREELESGRFVDLLHPSERASFDRQLQRLTRDRRGSFSAEYRCRRSDGTHVWVELTPSVVCDEHDSPRFLIVVAQDISRQVQLRDQLLFLLDASALLAPSVEVNEALVTIGEILVPGLADCCAVQIPGTEGWRFASHRDSERSTEVEACHGLLEALASRTTFDLSEPIVLSQVDPASLESGLGGGHDVRALERLGVCSVVMLPLTLAGRPPGILMLGQCSSGRGFESDDAPFLRELARRVASAVENAALHSYAKREVRLRERVLAVVSHDLRNPLGTIGLASALLLQNEHLAGDAAARRQIETIQRNAQRATRLISDLLDMSSIQAGKLAVERRPSDLTALIHEVREAWEPLARERHVQLDIIEEGDRAPADIDRDRIAQVIGNLVSNAIKFSHPEGRVTVRVVHEDDEVVVSVADRGPGISAEHRHHLFSPYWQGGHGAGGTGLGLFISRGIVEAHGGTIWVDSEEQRGTTMWFTLPRWADHPEGPPHDGHLRGALHGPASSRSEHRPSDASPREDAR